MTPADRKLAEAIRAALPFSFAHVSISGMGATSSSSLGSCGPSSAGAALLRQI